MLYRPASFSFLLVLLLPQSGVLAQNGGWKDSYNLNFSYDPSAANGPSGWGNVNGIGPWVNYNNQYVAQGGNQCASGNRQSPLQLQHISQSCRDVHELLPRQISNIDCTRQDVTFDVTPYALRASFPLTENNCTRPTLSLSGQFADYSLLWMEIHARSEHVIEGNRYDAELQMMHAGTGMLTGQLMEVSILIEATATADDLEFEWMLDQWEQTVNQETQACGSGRRHLRQVSDFEVSSKNRVAPEESHQRELQTGASPCKTNQFGGGCEPLGPRRRMFPYNLFPTIWYYAYDGSLTTPPCTAIVQWRVLDVPWQISLRQYKLMAHLLTQSRNSGCASDTAVNPTTGENFRPLQPRSQQFFQNLYRCTYSDFGYYVYPPSLQ